MQGTRKVRQGLQRISLLRIASTPASTSDNIALYVKDVLTRGVLMRVSEKLVLLLANNLEKSVFTNLISKLSEKGLITKGVSILDRQPYVGFLRGIKQLEKSAENVQFEEGVQGPYCIGKAFPRDEDLFERFYPEMINATAEIATLIKTINGLPLIIGSHVIFLIPCNARDKLEPYRGVFDYAIYEDEDPVRVSERLGLRSYWSILIL